MIPACPSLMCSFYRGNIEGTNFLCLHKDWFYRLTWQKIYMWDVFWNVHLLMTEFDSPEETLCGWQDVKIQLLTCWNLPGQSFLLSGNLKCTHLLFTGPQIFVSSRGLDTESTTQMLRRGGEEGCWLNWDWYSQPHHPEYRILRTWLHCFLAVECSQVESQVWPPQPSSLAQLPQGFQWQSG